MEMTQAMSPAKAQGGNSTDQAAASLSVMALKRDLIAFPKLDDERGSALAKFARLKSFAQGEALFAAGDVRCGSTKRVASAVGEGDGSAIRARIPRFQLTPSNHQQGDKSCPAHAFI